MTISETKDYIFWRKNYMGPTAAQPKKLPHTRRVCAGYEGSLSACEKRNRWLSFELIPSFVLILAKSGDKILAKNDTLKFTVTQIQNKYKKFYKEKTTQHWPCADIEDV